MIPLRLPPDFPLIRNQINIFNVIMRRVPGTSIGVNYSDLPESLQAHAVPAIGSVMVPCSVVSQQTTGFSDYGESVQRDAV
jgi:hypothetical protein